LDTRLTVFLSLARFPVILRRFHLNPGTGGNGFHRGGDGVVRELLFRRPQVLSVLGEGEPSGLTDSKVHHWANFYHVISQHRFCLNMRTMSSLDTREGK